MPPVTSADRQVLDGVRSVLHAELRHALRGRTEAVLLDAPLHRNVGDLLIVRGLLDSLAEMGVRVTQLQSWRLTSWRWLRRLPSTTAVLLSGGGNMGGLYPAKDAYRQRVLRTAAPDQVVMLPQSVSLSGADEVRAVRGHYEDHPEAVYLIRDRLSAQRLADAVPTIADSIRLAPDLAFGARLTPRGVATTDIRVIKRDDHEAWHDHLLDPIEGVRTVESDWPAFAWDYAEFRELTDFVRRRERMLRETERLEAVGLRAAAEAMIERSWMPRQQRLLRAHLGVAVASLQSTLEQGRIVVTDRLHAHLGASLLGIPNIVLRSLDGKGHALVDDWTSALSTTFVADAPTEATRLARGLLGTASAG